LYFREKQYVSGINLCDDHLHALQARLAKLKELDHAEALEHFEKDHQFETVKALQMKAWFQYLNGWHENAKNQTEETRIIFNQFDTDKKRYHSKRIELLLDAIFFTRAVDGESTKLDDVLRAQPHEHLERFKKNCECKTRMALDGYRYEQYKKLLEGF
jgi:hypothetical protein